MTAAYPQKINSLESLRGLAALSVVLCHTVQAFWPEITIGASAPLTSLWHNGGFAVRLFFVLSGFVLSLSFCRSHNIRVLRSAASRRYFRLYVPAAASIAFAYLIHAAGGFGALNSVKDLPGQTGWICNLYSGEPSLRLALREALLGPFLDYQFMKYNEVLWTMRVELQGSLLVFATLAVFGTARHRWLLYSVIVFALDAWHFRYSVDFACGMALCDCHCHFPARSRDSWLWVGVFVLGACLGDLQSGWVESYGIPGLLRGSRWWPTLAALLLVLAALRSSRLERALTASPLLWLGQASFALYLLHLPIICSLGAWTYMHLKMSNAAGTWSAMTASLVSVVASLAAASLGPALLDPLAISMGRWVERRLYPGSNQSEWAPLLHGQPLPVSAK